MTCSPFNGSDRKISNPVVVFEVVSESTRRIDQVSKLREYHAVATIQRYILVEQTGIALTVHSRRADDPLVTTVLGEGDLLSLREIGIELPVAAIYDDVTFDGADGPDREP